MLHSKLKFSLAFGVGLLAVLLVVSVPREALAQGVRYLVRGGVGLLSSLTVSGATTTGSLSVSGLSSTGTLSVTGATTAVGAVDAKASVLNSGTSGACTGATGAVCVNDADGFAVANGSGTVEVSAVAGTVTSAATGAAFVMATNARLTGDGTTAATNSLSHDGFKWTVAASEGAYFANGVKVGVNGNRLTESISSSGTIDFASIAAGACADNTLTINQVATNTAVACSFPAALEAGLAPSCWITAANTVTFRLCNATAGAVDPASGTFAARTIK